MTNERFKELLEELDGNSVKTLAEKNSRYSADSGDALHNFKNGAEILGGTPAQACWGYMTKHLVALRDKVERNDFSDRDDFLEKCQDTINYIRFLWCIGNEEEKVVTEDVTNTKTPVIDESSKGVYVYEIKTGKIIDFIPKFYKPAIADLGDKFGIRYVMRNSQYASVYEYDKYRYETI